MTRLAHILRGYRQTGALNALINLYGFVDDQTFLTKSGDLGVVLAVEGVDDECLDADERDRVARRFEAALRVFDEHTYLLQYVVKRPRLPDPPMPHADLPIEALLDRRDRFETEQQARLYAFAIYWVVIATPARDAAAWGARFRRFLAAPLATIRLWLSTRRTIARLDDEIEALRERLHQQVQAFVVQLEDTVRPRVVSKRRAFQFFRRLANYDPEKAEAVRLREDTFLDYHVCDSALECHRGHLRLDDAYVRVLTLKEPPAQTFAHVLRALEEVPSSLVLMSDWQRAEAGRVRRMIHAMRRHFHQAQTRVTTYLGDAPTIPGEVLVDDSAAALVRDLGACLTDLTIHGRYFGRYTLTVVLYDRDPAALARSVATCVKACGAHDAQLTEERPNLLNAWLAVLPGNTAYNLRAMWLLNTNAADLAFLFAPDRGSATNAHLGTEALTVLETMQGTAYHLNLHSQDVAHTLVLGATGSGKSFLLNFLVAQLQRYRPRTTIFDLGGSYQALTAYVGGTALHAGGDRRNFTINPFSLEPTPANRQFLWAFVKVLIQSGGQYTMSEVDDRDLYEQIEALHDENVDADQRRLFTLATILRKPLQQQLQRWVQGGQYADLFDNLEDTLTLARFQTIDFDGLDDAPQLLEPVLFYLLHRADAAIADPAEAGALKVFVVDEAWRFLRDPTIRAYVTAAFKTWRKNNACMLLATQSSEDLVRSALLRDAVESCATICFLANPQIDRAVYQDVFHLTETQAARIATLLPRRQFLLKRPEVAKVLTLRVDAESARLFSLGGGVGGDGGARRPAGTLASDPISVFREASASQLDLFGSLQEGVLA
jgi:type IV secretion system protein VirB4